VDEGTAWLGVGDSVGDSTGRAVAVVGIAGSVAGGDSVAGKVTEDSPRAVSEDGTGVATA
jgi:hypothetical protein